MEKETKKEILQSIDKMPFREKIQFINNTRLLYNSLCPECKQRVMKNVSMDYDQYCEDCKIVAYKYLKKWVI